MTSFAYKITVIMPSYNNGQYIRQALDSILSQKVNFSCRIIVTDDASTDDSPEIIREYEKKYPDKILALYSDKNQKLFSNYLKALEKMDSEYFCVLDPDDYWTDEHRLQKAVDFLDEHPDYTIYATNLHKLYNDGTMELKYDYPYITTYTSTYEDYIRQRAILSCTPSSTYRNVFYAHGIPEAFGSLKGTRFEGAFRADTARNLIHLKRGKAWFVNESVGVCRVHGRGLDSGLQKFEKSMEVAFCNIGYYEFFGKENQDLYAALIKRYYTGAVGEYYAALLNGEIPELTKEFRDKYRTVSDWLQEHRPESKGGRVPFSLELFGALKHKQLIIWGTGTGARKVLDKYNIEVRQDTLFVDSNVQKQGQKFLEREIISPDDVKNYKEAVVLIASGYYAEIIQQIRENGLCEEEQILNLYDYENNWV